MGMMVGRVSRVMAGLRGHPRLSNGSAHPA
jgi:hypothetical protein